LRLILFDHVGTPIGSPTSFQLRRKALVRYMFALIFVI
jgi:hypothetical protein